MTQIEDRVSESKRGLAHGPNMRDQHANRIIIVILMLSGQGRARRTDRPALADDAPFEFGAVRAKMWNTNVPPAVVVSIASVSERKPVNRRRIMTCVSEIAPEVTGAESRADQAVALVWTSCARRGTVAASGTPRRSPR